MTCANAMTGVERDDRRTVLLATSSVVLRRRWQEELDGSLDLIEAVDRVEFEERVLTGRPDVTFLDLALPGLKGLEGVQSLHRMYPAARVVLLASAPTERQAILALVAGARGYCDRNIAPQLVRKATEVVQRGEIWIGRRVVPHLLRRITSLASQAATASSPRLPTPFHYLAPRERQIALLVAEGANNKDIAVRLSITEATVKAHLTAVFRKLNVSGRLRLALFLSRQRARGLRVVRR